MSPEQSFNFVIIFSVFRNYNLYTDLLRSRRSEERGNILARIKKRVPLSNVNKLMDLEVLESEFVVQLALRKKEAQTMNPDSSHENRKMYVHASNFCV